MLKLNNNIYIINLEGSHIINAMRRDSEKGYTDKYKNKDGKIVKTPFRKLYKASLPMSLTRDNLLINNLKVKNDTINNTVFNYTDNIINVNFNYSNMTKEEAIHKNGNKYIKKNILSALEVREILYQDGFNYNGKHYIEFGRTSSKARGGSTLFIKETLYDKIKNDNNVDLEFNENNKLDIASCRAYQMLEMSELKSYVTIEPKTEILLVDDLECVVYDDCYVTTFNNTTEEVETNLIENYPVKNKIFDGESLMQSNLFDGEGCKLLRNKWFKSNANNTEIQLFFSNHKDLIKNGKVYDMFGRELNAKDIKLICTPSSIKFLKLAEYKFNSKKEAYLYWLDHIENKFGVCMSEEESTWTGDDGVYNQLSYQMLNSFNLNYDEVKSLCEEELNYVLQLKNNINIFRNHIGCFELSNSREFIYNILALNKDVKGTKLFKQFKNNTINKYKEKIAKGKLKLRDADYSVCVGNPMELLYWSLGKDITKENKYLGKGEVYCNAFTDGEELTIIRNPHIATNNIQFAVNKHCEDFNTYLNLTKNNIIIDSIYNNILNRCNGMDFDVDKVIRFNKLTDKSKEAMNYPTPVNAIESELVPQQWNSKNLAYVDYKIAKGKTILGEIVNLSQEIQSIYWDEYSKGKDADQEYLTFLNKTCCTLANISNIAIDSAKKTFPKKLKLQNELDRIKEIKYKGIRVFKKVILPPYLTIDKEGYLYNKLTKKKSNEKLKYADGLTKKQEEDGYKLVNVKSLFFRTTVKTDKKKKNKKNNKFYYYVDFNCPMNYLQKVLYNRQEGVKRISGTDILDLLETQDIDVNKANRVQIDTLTKYAEDLRNELSENTEAYSKCQDGKAKVEVIKARKLIKSNAEEYIRKLKINKNTIIDLFKLIYSNNKKDNNNGEELRKNGLLLMGYIYKTHTDLVVSLFKQEESHIELKECKDGTINIWGKKYKEEVVINKK